MKTERPARVELIAEVATNHGGDLSLAGDFIRNYADAGADWIKFQSYQVATLRAGDPQQDWLARAELSDAAHVQLQRACAATGVGFLTTVFHACRVPFLATLGLAAIKVGSGEATELDLATAVCAGPFPRIFVSQGLGPVARRYRRQPFGRVTRFACESRYPAPHGLVPLGVRGWSDHCVGLMSCEVAILAGANYIEKHVSLPHQARPRHVWEATLDEFRALRAFADDDPVARFRGRWQAPPAAAENADRTS